MYVFFARSRRRALHERQEAAQGLRDTLDLGSYVDSLTGRCAQELESNNFGDAIRLAMRKRPA